MSLEEKLCLSMLERLKKLQETHQLFSSNSDAYMQNIKSQTPPLLVSTHIDSTANSVNDLSSNNALVMLNSNEDVNLDSEYCQKISKSYFTHDDENYCEEKNILDEFENAQTGAKFPFLKKGQGIARFKTRQIKGFRKKSSLVKNHIPMSKLQLKKPKIRNALLPIDSNVPDCNQTKRVNAFEKLEELVERDSFCSKSSQVIELLHDEPSFCSTPISSKTTFEQSLTLTPIGKEKCRKQIIKANSPSRNYHTKNLETQSVLISQVQNLKLLEFAGNGESQAFVAKSLSGVKNYSGSGILKKNTPDSCTVSSPSVSKVTFHDEGGVKVLEYDDSETETNVSTACSEASDLLSSSDLKNLMLFNYKFNVIHESSFIDDTDIASKIAENNGYALENSKSHRRESFHSAFKSNHPVVNVQTEPELLVKKKPLSAKLDTVNSIKSNCGEDKNNLDLNTHKNLLLSKVDDLTKEIDIFKKRNKGLEALMTELETEKKILLEKQQKSELEKKASTLACSTKIKKKERDEKLSQSQTSNVSIKLEELNEKLNKLNTENNNLKIKVMTLERKERELKKSNEEKNKENKASRGKKQCMNYKLKQMPKSLPVNSTNRSVIQRKSTNDTPKEKQIKRIPLASGVTTTKCISNVSGELERQNEEPISLNNAEHNSNGELIRNEPEWLAVEDSSNRNSGSDIPVSEAIEGKSMQNPRNLFTIQETDEDITKYDSSVCTPNTVLDNQLPKRKYVEKYNNSTQKAMRTNADNVEIIDIPSRIGTRSVTVGSPDSRVVTFENGDQKTTCEDKEIYHYAKDNVVHTMHKDDGREEIEFANGQREIYFKDGSYQIIFPDSSSKSVYKDGSEVCVWKDGTVIKVSKTGLKSVHFPNGQREIHEHDAVRRLYPDGTVKILYRDGKQETRYTNGKIRIKEKDGTVYNKKK